MLLYGCKTWKVTETNTRDLQTFINSCIRKIFKNFGLMLSQTKKCGGIHWRRIPLSQRNKLCIGRGGNLKRGWWRMIEDEAGKVGETWWQVNAIAGKKSPDVALWSSYPLSTMKLTGWLMSKDSYMCSMIKLFLHYSFFSVGSWYSTCIVTGWTTKES